MLAITKEIRRFWEDEEEDDDWEDKDEVANTKERKGKLCESMVPKVPIWDAAINRQWATVKQCLTRDPSLIRITGIATIRNYICEKLTLLHLAVANNAGIEIWKFLFSHKANIHAKDNWDKTPLDYADTDEKKRMLLEAMAASRSVTEPASEKTQCNPPTTPANWHYYNESGEKITVTARELKQIALQGTVTPETFVETHDGRTGLAKHVNGLTFPAPG
jgi:hypothetical protein